MTDLKDDTQSPRRSALRLRVPMLLDVVVVSEPEHIHWLNSHAGVVRHIDPASSIVHRLIDRRLREDLGFEGAVLPVFRPRSDEAREQQRGKLEAELEALRGGPGPERDAIADYVAGEGDGSDIGSIVQQWCGRLFSAQYTATRESYEAGKLLAGWPSSLPWKAWADRRSGRLLRAKQRVLEQAQGDLHCAHGTSIGMENVAKTVRALREAAQDTHKQTLPPDDILRECLAVPPAVLRGCEYEIKAPFLDAPLTRQTLVVFQVARAFAASGDLDVAFLRDGWSRCPAHAVVPEMLRAAWHAAHHDEPASEPERVIAKINTWTRILHQVVS